ncbi:MAG TPA: FAD:protein FMN transferase [Sandaracinaceae bacterium LLY-WYZ-13_1]|nr:FAD:protein FMN transferase [Sandaracinaceae bacterium LLY-WYZ-13_1]
MRRAPLILPLLCALAAPGCDDEPELREVDLGHQTADEAPEPGDGDAEEEADETEEPAGDEVRLVQRSRPIMGTVFQVSVAGMPEAEAGPLIGRALDEIERLEAVLSEWRDDTEVSAINQAAGGEAPVEVGPDTLRVVEAGLDVSRWSDGAFDLSWAALRGLYTFQPGERRIPPLREVRERLRLVDWRAIELDEEASTVRLAREGMSIGTGGIGKGYALDRAGDVLREGGAESFMLFGGGQVQVHGMRGDRPWRVGIQHPRDPRTYIGFLEATEGSISTSGDYEHAFVDEEGTHWHHIIDLSTGLPARRTMQVTLLAPRGVYADALSTAAFVLGPERALAMLAEVPGGPEAVIIDPRLGIHTTPGTEDRLIMRVPVEDGRIPGEPTFRGWRGR